MQANSLSIKICIKISVYILCNDTRTYHIPYLPLTNKKPEHGKKCKEVGVSTLHVDVYLAPVFDETGDQDIAFADDHGGKPSRPERNKGKEAPPPPIFSHPRCWLERPEYNKKTCGNLPRPRAENLFQQTKFGNTRVARIRCIRRNAQKLLFVYKMCT